MNRWTVLLAALLLMFVAVGCSSGGGSPAAPATDPGLTGSASHVGQGQTHLWGYYDVYIDVENQTVEALVNRDVMFAANVVTFLNGKPANLGFQINDTPAGVGFIDVDLDVSITHPFPGMHQYDGYDVRGIFIADGTQDMITCYALCCWSLLSKPGTDQFMKDYDVPGHGHTVGSPDGYTRWWNPTEFVTPGVVGYTPGIFASKGYIPTATVNPYKYFADGLGAEDDRWEFLTGGTTDGVFSAGIKNTRNYYLRFPSSKGVKFAYAVVANWVDEETHPANAPEAVGCKVDVTPDVYYVDPAHWGGDLILDVSIFDWDSSVNDMGVMDDYTITVVSWNLFKDAAPTEDHQYVCNTAEMTPISEGDNFYTYHVEIPVTDLKGTEGNEFVIKAICGKPDGTVFEDYTNPFGIPNNAGEWPLTAYFRYDLYVSSEPYNTAPVIDSGVDGEDNPLIVAVETYTVTAHDVDGDPLTYSWTVTDVDAATELLSDDPGNGDGTIDIDWGDLGAKDEGEYDVDCVVSDGTDEVPATTLTAIATAIVYLYDGTVDDGDMEEVGFATGPANWTFVGAQDVWDENGDTATSPADMCRTLGTPQLDIPSGGSGLKLEITHSGYTQDYYGYYSRGSGMVGYTTDSGTSINFDKTPCSYSDSWLSYDSGFNFNHAYPYGNLGFYSTYYLGCDPWSGWNYTVFCDKWGAVGSPETTTWTCNSLQGKNDVQLCFNFNSCPSWLGFSGTGWQINKIKLYLVP